MLLVAPSDPGRSRPFRIVDGESEWGPRIGGRAPDGVSHGLLRSDAVYVLTLAVATQPELELSVFLQGELWDAMNRGLRSDDRVLLVPHPPAPRSKDRRLASALSEHRIVLGDEIPDLDPRIDDGHGPKPYSDHKVGGRPYCIQEPELDGAEALLARGLRQLLQLDFPGAQDAGIHGDWPFANGLFNLFGGPPFEEFFWAFQE